MSLKTNIEAAVHIAYLDLKEFHKIGWVQYRISIFYTPKDNTQNIHFMAYNIAASSEQASECKNNQPFITQDSHYCYSRKIKVKYLNDVMAQKVSYYFKVYIDLTLLDKINVFINVDLLFSENYKIKFQIMHQYYAAINVYHNILTFLPVTFDNYGTLRLAGNFHATLMQYKFQKNQDDSHLIEKQYQDVQAYFQASTLGFRSGEILTFYDYYRENLQKELSGLLDRFSEACKLLDKLQKRPKYIKLNRNKKLSSILQEINQINFIVLTQTQKDRVISAILSDFINIKALIYQNWNQFNIFLQENSDKINASLQSKYQEQLKERMKANIFSHRIKNHDWTFNRYNDEPKIHLDQAELIRKKSQSESQLWKDIFPIQDIHFYEQAGKSIKIFEQIYQTGMLPLNHQVPHQFEHVIILVHGFQAHSKDFTQFKKCLQARHRTVKIYISASNINKTQQSIKNMGKRLAIQVTRYTQILKRPYKLSFIGHSMGGIVIRSALAHIQPLWKHLHAYVSICSPHLGYLYAPSKLVQAGLWLLNTWQKCDSIMELSMQDNQNLRDCFLYKLAAQPYLSHFHKISFISSSQDQYVPYESALAVKNTTILIESLKNKIESDIICELVDNMLCQVQTSEISRVDVIFSIQEKNFDSFIGRTGHVKFLCDPHFIKQFVISLSHLFV